MATVYIPSSPAIKGESFTFYTSLVSQAGTNVLQANPTLAAGDVQVSIDGGIAANIASLPTIIASATKVLAVNLTATEMNGNKILILFSDVTGSEWQDMLVELLTYSEVDI